MADNATNGANPNDLSFCTVDICPIDSSYYNYRINLVPNAVFLALFSISFLAFLAIGIATRRGLFFMTAMLLGLASEILGYVGRILSYQNQWAQTGFLMQIVCLTIGPAFFAAGIYVCLARIVIVYGRENSRVPPEWYTRTFIPCDMVALILQAVGGTIASIALQDNQSLTTGDNIMIAGLASQVFTLFAFMLLCADFAVNVWRRTRRLGKAAALAQDPVLARIRDSWPFRGFLGALVLATVAIFWRSTYRVAELNQGWLGPLTYNQGLFVGFEGVLVVLAVAALGIFNPALCLGEAMDGKGADVRPAEVQSGGGYTTSLGTEAGCEKTEECVLGTVAGCGKIEEGALGTEVGCGKTEEVVQYPTNPTSTDNAG